MSETKNNKPRVLGRSHGKIQPDMKPIVLEYKGRKKVSKAEAGESKEKYSDELEDIQVLEGDAMRVAQRAVKALSKGIDTYEHERQKSAKEKTDGAIEDFFHNSAKATSVYMKEASDIPVVLVEIDEQDFISQETSENPAPLIQIDKLIPYLGILPLIICSGLIILY